MLDRISYLISLPIFPEATPEVLRAISPYICKSYNY